MVSFHAAVVTPTGKVFEDECDSVTAPGREGFLEILGNHTPIIIILKQGVLTVKQKSATKYFINGTGILEVDEKHNVLIVVDFAVSVSDLKEARERLKNDHHASIFATN